MVTVLTLHATQTQSTSLLSKFCVSVEQTAKNFFSWNQQMDTYNNPVYIIHPTGGKLLEVDPNQLWFWTSEWQAGEQQVESELIAGEYEDFDNLDDFFRDM